MTSDDLIGPKRGRHKGLKSLVGQRFGRLTVVEQVPRPEGRVLQARFWVSSCDCGGTALSSTYDLTHGKSTSCGCKRNESVSVMMATHRLTKTSEYRSWYAMKTRCSNPRQKDWHLYGGRGISVCPRWSDSFESFLADMGPKPTVLHTIERIDTDGNYEPGNCCWATRSDQRRNQRRNCAK